MKANSKCYYVLRSSDKYQLKPLSQGSHEQLERAYFIFCSEILSVNLCTNVSHTIVIQVQIENKGD